MLRFFVGRDGSALEVAKADGGLLIEDFGGGVHPMEAVEKLADLRKSLGDAVLTLSIETHSCFVVNELEPGELFVCARKRNGVVEVKAITAHPDFERWNKSLKLGELWSVVGEEWVIKPTKKKKERQSP